MTVDIETMNSIFINTIEDESKTILFDSSFDMSSCVIALLDENVLSFILDSNDNPQIFESHEAAKIEASKYVRNNPGKTLIIFRAIERLLFSTYN
jgi:hypothetical protein